MAKLEIFENSLIKLIVRKGPNTDRLQSTLSEGEPGYTVDTKRLFVGDGTTPGGVLAGNKFIGYSANLTTLPTVPGEVGDMAYNTSNSTLYYIQSGTGTITDNWIPISTNISTTTFNGLTTVVRSSSASWNTAYTTTTSISAKANNTYTTVRSNSALWDAAYTNTQITPYYATVVSLTGNITLGTNNTTTTGLSGKFISYFDEFLIDKFIITSPEPPADFGAGEMDVSILKNGVQIDSVFIYEPSNYGELIPGSPVALTIGDRLHINVLSINSTAQVRGLNLHIKGRLN
jgi:hypothetical protein